MKYFIPLGYYVSEIQCVCYTHSTSLFRPATNNHTWLAAILFRQCSSILFRMDRQTSDATGVLGPPKFKVLRHILGYGTLTVLETGVSKCVCGRL